PRTPPAPHSLPTRRSSDLRLTHESGDAGTTGGKSSAANPTIRYVAPPHRRLTITFSVTFNATAAAGSSFTISASFRAETVILPRSEEHTSELQSPDHLVCR